MNMKNLKDKINKDRLIMFMPRFDSEEYYLSLHPGFWSDLCFWYITSVHQDSDPKNLIQRVFTHPYQSAKQVYVIK